jgi:hypothetical protein
LIVKKDLPAEHMTVALQRIAAWRNDPFERQTCPLCGAPDLEIVDRSARPFAEWYALTCAACGLETTVHIPLPGPSGIL